MHIQSVRFTNPDRDEIEVTSDLGDFYLPWPCDTWHRQAIHQWLEMGNKIQPFLPEVDVEKARKALSREVYRHAAQLLDEATADYSMIEKVIWPDLEREARRFMMDGSIGPLIQAELDTSTQSAEELTYRIMRKANALTKLRGAVIAARIRHLKRIGMASLDELTRYDMFRDWPNILGGPGTHNPTGSSNEEPS